jgi:hypothetical protein
MRAKSKCRKCRFSGKLGYGQLITCDYILIMKVPRGCPPGPECTKFEPKGKIKRKPDWL